MVHRCSYNILIFIYIASRENRICRLLYACSSHSQTKRRPLHALYFHSPPPQQQLNKKYFEYTNKRTSECIRIARLSRVSQQNPNRLARAIQTESAQQRIEFLKRARARRTQSYSLGRARIVVVASCSHISLLIPGRRAIRRERVWVQEIYTHCSRYMCNGFLCVWFFHELKFVSQKKKFCERKSALFVCGSISCDCACE